MPTHRDRHARHLSAAGASPRPAAHPFDPAAAGDPLTQGDLDRSPAIRESCAPIRDCLTRNGWNISRTAAALEMSRNTLYRKIRRHGIVPG
jgi:sigma-54 dependent transcriptional regulator, acetoin dehydrogenase operon transcriptional activator AcoR